MTIDTKAMTPQEAVEFCKSLHKELPRFAQSGNQIFPGDFTVGSLGWFDDTDDAGRLTKLRNALPALRKVIEDQQREVERLSSLANRALCDIDCTACDRWLNDSAKMNGNGELYCAECYESEREAWL